MSKTINLAVIAGDGIGPEVVAEGLKVLDVVGAKHVLLLTRPLMILVRVIGIELAKFYLTL